MPRWGRKRRARRVLTEEEEAAVVAFRRYTLPLDDCLYALPPGIPRSHALLSASLPETARNQPAAGGCGDKANKQKFATYPTGDFYIDIAKWEQKMASCICLGPWIAPRSSPMPSFIPAPRA